MLRGDKLQWDQEGATYGDFSKLDDTKGPGAWASFKPGARVQRRNSKWALVEDEPSTISISYREAEETQFAPDPRRDIKLVNYSTRVFNTIMNEINEGDKSEDERREIYEDAIKFAHRSILEHELTHASHYIGTELETRERLKDLLEAGDSEDELFDKFFKKGVLASFTREGRERMVRKAMDDLIWKYWYSNSSADLMAIEQQATQLNLNFYQVLDAIFNTKMLYDAKGRRVPISPQMARYIQAITGDMIRPRPGEYMNFAHVFALLGARQTPQNVQPGYFAFISTSNLAIALDRVASRVDVAARRGMVPTQYPVLDMNTFRPIRDAQGNNVKITGPGITKDILDILDEVGFPGLEDRNGTEVHPGIPPKDARKILAAFRVSMARKMHVERRAGTSDYGYDRQTPPDPVVPISQSSVPSLEKLFEIDKLDDAVIDDVLSNIQETLSRQLNAELGGNAKKAGRVLSTLSDALGFWDKLSTQEIEDIREVAALLGGGIYNPYAGTKVGFSDIFAIGALADTPEIFAELGSLAMVGQTIALRDRSGDPIDVTPSQKAALIKLLRWLKPGSAPVVRGA